MTAGHRQVKIPLPFYVEGVTEVDIQRIYKARCEDGQIPLLPEQLRRFYDFCGRNIKNRRFSLTKSNLGPKSAEAVANIIRNNHYFSELELRNNELGDKGAVILGKTLWKCINLVYVGLGGNDIGVEGMTAVLESVGRSQSIVSVDVSSIEGLHRNRVTGKAAEALIPLLHNPVLIHLNLSGTGLGPEGLNLLAQGFTGNTSLLSLDLANNNLTRGLDPFLRSIIGSRLSKLTLSGNKLSTAGCDLISTLLCGGLDGYCPLQYLDLAKNDITQVGVSRLYRALCRNGGLKTLILDNNPLGPGAGPEFYSFLIENRSLNTLSLAYCELRPEAVAAFSEGLIKNHSLKSLNLSWNALEDPGAVSVATGLGKNEGLELLDLSSNRIHDAGGMAVCEALRTNHTLETLLMADNNVHDAAAQLMTEIMRGNKSLLRLSLRYNPIHQKYLNELSEIILSNQSQQRRKLMPELYREIDKLQVKTGAIQEIEILHNRKKTEEIELNRQLVETEGKFDHFRTEEERKFESLRAKFRQIVSEKDQKDSELVQLQAETMVNFQLDRRK